MVMLNTDEDDLENGPSLVVTLGPNTLPDDDGDDATPTAAADDSIVSRVRRQGAPRPILPCWAQPCGLNGHVPRGNEGEKHGRVAERPRCA
eukprot:159548-Pleurochrysis_carterae.AAC.1